MFFIEKSKQLLKANGVAGIIVPSSILNKGSQNIGTNKANVYVTTREIILKYFDIVSIAEFGSGTFGKTGTNTVTLFLKRKSTNLDISQHLKNMVDSWFECDFETNEVFEDSELLKEYCKHLNYDFNIYKTLLCENLDVKLFDYEMFKEYKTEFEKLTDTKNRRKTKTYIALQIAQKDEIEQKELIKFIKAIEKEKLYYFCLAYKNSCEVVIVKSPSDGKENKKFLGYEWSSAKGNEGIHYLSSTTINIEDESLDEGDIRILENLSGLKHINTPLYNPQNSDDETKINKIIKDNFDEIKTKIPTELETYVNRAKLVDMIDFSRVDFNKAIALSVKNMKPLNSKYEQLKLSELFLEIKNGKNVNQIDDIGQYKVSRIETISTGVFNINAIKWTNDKVREEDFLQHGDILFSHINSVQHLGKTALFNIDEKIVHGVNLLRFRPNRNIINFKYAYEVFQLKEFTNEIKNQAQKAINQASVNTAYLNEIKIPLPPLDIQELIVKECQKIDDVVLKSNETIEQTKVEMKNKILSFSENNLKKVSLESISLSISTGLTPLRTNSQFWQNGTIPWLKTEQLGEKYIYDTNEKISIIALEKTSIKINPKNTLSIAMYGEGRTRGSLSILKEEMTTNQACCNVYLDDKKANYEYVYYYLTTQYENLRSLASGVRHNLNTSHIKNYMIPLPSIETQKQIVSEIEKLEVRINEAKRIIDGAKEKKEEILKNYL